MRRLIFLILIIMTSSCDDSFHAPGDKEIQQAVRDLYENRNGLVGGGGWIVNDVWVVRILHGNDQRHYKAEVSVNGVHTSPALAVRRPDEPFNEIREVTLNWSGGKWVIPGE
jgi:hypothetical protein